MMIFSFIVMFLADMYRVSLMRLDRLLIQFGKWTIRKSKKSLHQALAYTLFFLGTIVPLIWYESPNGFYFVGQT
jgi:hypothetical protein